MMGWASTLSGEQETVCESGYSAFGFESEGRGKGKVTRLERERWHSQDNR